MKQKSILFIGTYKATSGKGSQKNKCMSEEIAERLAINKWKIIITSKKNGRFLRFLDMVWVIVSQSKNYSIAEVDVFSGLAFFWSLICTEILRLYKKPIILILRGGNLPLFATNHPGLVKRLLDRAAAIVAPSNYLIENLSCFGKKIVLIPNGIDINLYPYRFRDNPQPRLIWLRAFHKIYNASLAPKVVRLLKNTDIYCNLTMVGPDKGDGSLQEMLLTTKELMVDENIQIIRGVNKNQIPEILNQYDIFLNTTNFDNTPVSVIEGMACGLCIVSTNVGGIPFLLNDGIDALLVPPNDAQMMADSINKILSQPELAKNLSRNSRSKAEQLDWAIILPQWENLFNCVLLS